MPGRGAKHLAGSAGCQLNICRTPTQRRMAARRPSAAAVDRRGQIGEADIAGGNAVRFVERLQPTDLGERVVARSQPASTCTVAATFWCLASFR